MGRRVFTDATEFGIVLALAGAFLFVLQDSSIKWVTTSLAVIQILFLRNLIAMGLLWSVAALTGRPIVLKTQNPRLMLLRSLIGVAGWYCFFAGLKHLPLATVMALFFSFPIFLTALSVPILGEKVGPRRWAAVLVGFCGVLVITRPGAALEWPMLYVLGASLSWALVAILTRKLGKTESTSTMVFYALASFVAVMAVPIYWVWAPPSMLDLGLISLAAVVGVSAQMCLIRAYTIAEPAVIGPIEYTGLVWAALLGYLIWGDLPDLFTLCGALIIVASGLYIIQREAGGFRRGLRR